MALVLEPKLCVRCRERPEHVSANGQRRSWCSRCLNKSNVETKAKNPEKYFWQRRNAHLIRTFGITHNDYDELLRGQGGGCAICGIVAGARRKLAVDHDAATGKVRGLLCENCNRAIGQLGHDPERIVRAAEYLRRY